MRFNMKTGMASQKKLSAPAVDFPRVNESYTGRYVVAIFLLELGNNWVNLLLERYRDV